MLQNVIVCQTEGFLNAMLNLFSGSVGIAAKRFYRAFSKNFTGKLACCGTPDTVCCQTEMLIGIYKECILVVFTFKSDIGLAGKFSAEHIALFQLVYLNVAKVGGLQSQGVKGEAVVGYRELLTTQDLKSSGFPGG
jgi:hypothetical protein